MTKQHATDTLAPDALEVITAMAPLAPTAWMSTAWLDNMAAMNTAIAAFVAERIKEDVQTQQALFRCKTLGEVKHVQAAFLQKAVAQYQAETGKLIALTGRLATDLHAMPEAKT